MTMYQCFDSRFDSKIIGHAKLEKLWQGGRWLEGPAYFAAGQYLIFSDIPNNRMMRFDETNQQVAVFRSPANNSNGNTVDSQGRLITCEHLSRSVTRTEHDGNITVLASHFESRRLNSPNDVVVHSDGSLWFTDPTYGIDSDYEGARALSEVGASNVYRLTPDGQVKAMIVDRLRPNGLAFSPDEKTLYVSDTGASHQAHCARAIHAYRVDPSPEYIGPFCKIDSGFFDGFRFDSEGCLWTSAGNAVHCYHPDGTLMGAIPIGEAVSNLCFGSAKRNRLYITAQTSLYSIYLNSCGLT